MHRLAAVTDEVGQRLLRRAEAGGVGNCTLHDADEDGQVAAAHLVKGEDNQHVKQHHDEHQRVQLQPFALEGGEEAGADLQTDGVNEENQPKLFDEMGDMFIDGKAEVGEDDAGEQHQRHAEGDAENAQAAKCGAAEDGESVDDGGVGDALVLGE